MTKLKDYFTKTEKLLWLISVVMIVSSYLAFDRGSVISLIASLVGVTAIILNAKGNPFGQFLMVIFSILYGIISYSFRYYGEMITYVLMTGPMALFALISWLRHPYKGNKAEVEVNNVTKKEITAISVLTVIITVIFYYLLGFFGTANLLISTFSVTTSFVAVSLTYLRSEYFSVAYAMNDIVLIILWAYAALFDISYISVVICFAAFLANDIYAFLSWQKMKKKQQNNC